MIRSSAEERLGLTLCYEQDEIEENLTHIFIDEIHPDGLAARDERLRLGDQIIQVSEFADYNPVAKSGEVVKRRFLILLQGVGLRQSVSRECKQLDSTMTNSTSGRLKN